MMKHLLGVCVLLAIAAPALAEINPETFDPANGYAAGTPLSANYWTENIVPDSDPPETVDTTGVLDIVDAGGDHGLVVKMTANGPDPGPGFPAVLARTEPWGGPGRGDAGDQPLYFAVDIEKGSGNTLTSFLYQLTFLRGNGNAILTLDGGLGTFRLKTASGNTAAYTLGQGWNQVAVVNDLSLNPNTSLYLNGKLITSLNVTSGPLQSGSTSTANVTLNRQARGGTGDPFVGTVRFDNIVTANEDIIKFLTGDVSHDGIVDISDIQTIAANYLTAGPTGDANNDGIVDISDIQVIAAHYLDGSGGGVIPGTGSGTAVPEPASAGLMALGLVIGAVHVYRRRRAGE
ncbi:MAG: PEP-CTERM sorting domain-containing protein [Planctomycetia bacterium]|nr:PEP-CTERM sorting domain-containing protein [Planctomycetia bacterium]